MTQSFVEAEQEYLNARIGSLEALLVSAREIGDTVGEMQMLENIERLKGLLL